MSPPSESRPTPNPYAGARPLGPGDRLYGRTREKSEVFNLLIAERIVLLFAPSGAGKTSLIEAGLVPQLRRRGFEVLPTARVGQEPPLGGSALVREQNRYVRSVLRCIDAGAATASPDAPLPSLKEVLGRGQAPTAPTVNRVLVLDQFEEVLSADPIDSGAKDAFFQDLGKALLDRRLWALLAMREDYIAGLTPFLDRLPGRLSARYRLDLLDHGQAMEVVVKLAADREVVFEAEAADTLVNDLCRTRVQRLDGRLEPEMRIGEHVEPVQMQVVCERLWDQAPASGPLRITTEDVKRLEGVDRALWTYYDKKVGFAAEKSGVPERRIRDWIGRELILTQGTRGYVPKGEGVSNGLPNEAIQRLVEGYIVREEQRHGSTWWYELTHDRLIEPIRTSNAQWLQRNLKDWQIRAATWVAQGRPPHLLASAEQLAQAREWQALHSGELSDNEKDYLLKSQVSIAVTAPHAAGVSRMYSESGARDLKSQGWAVLFPMDGDPAIREALAPLLEHRKKEAGTTYREFSGRAGYSRGESGVRFLRRHGVGFGGTDKNDLPFHVLIVGDPEHGIPFLFQYQMSLRYSVGRLHFDDVAGYASYAKSVVAAETAPAPASRKAVLFAPSQPGDRFGKYYVDNLVQPVSAQLQGSLPEWSIAAVSRTEATKARLLTHLGSQDPPRFFLYAGRGMALFSGHAQQRELQGALLCQDWPGSGPFLPAHYFCAADIPDDARLSGTVVFLVAPFSAGTPRLEDFPLRPREPKALADGAFVSALSQRLLGHPNGGALAVVGHIERTQPNLATLGLDPQMVIWNQTIRRVLDGATVGEALEFLNMRYAELTAMLSADLEAATLASDLLSPPVSSLIYPPATPEAPPDEATSHNRLDELLLGRDRIEAIDARNYVILGDPAVMLAPTDEPGKSA